MKNIEELNIKELEKEALKELAQSPKGIAEIAAILDVQYTTAFGKLKVWEAKKWINKINPKKSVKYFLNQDEIQVTKET